jgi:anaerobic magnesium-protoporphyrin IX monomethyl ester cyclase
MRILLIRTPRYVWPFNSETSAFWQPLGLMSLAGQLERDHPDCQVDILDCPGSRIGWKTLTSKLDAGWPDVVCVGEETASSHEALRLARYVKERHPSTKVVAGGYYFSNVSDEPLSSRKKGSDPAKAVRHRLTASQEKGSDPVFHQPPQAPFFGTIDYIVHGEGEVSLSELIGTIKSGGDAGLVKGISFVREGKVIRTGGRALIANLDDLPMPAWSKVPMHLYGKGARNHPGLVSIEHGRGCTDSCDFCNLWSHMGRQAGDGSIMPFYRTKSPQRSFEEVERLAADYGRRTFGWVDPTWNADPRWTEEFSGLVLRSGLKIRQTAWVRADCIVRDEKLGILEKAVKSGLCQVMIGVERPGSEDLRGLGKHCDADVTARAFEILRTKYPSVFTIGSVVFGVWDETSKSLNELAQYQYKIGMDYCFFIPLTPNPGTEVGRRAAAEGTVEVKDLAAYNFHTPVMRTRLFSAKRLETLYLKLVYGLSWNRIAAHFGNLIKARDARCTGVHRSLFKYGVRIAALYMWNRLRNPFSDRPTIYSRKPAWYDS